MLTLLLKQTVLYHLFKSCDLFSCSKWFSIKFVQDKYNLISWWLVCIYFENNMESSVCFHNACSQEKNPFFFIGFILFYKLVFFCCCCFTLSGCFSLGKGLIIVTLFIFIKTSQFCLNLSLLLKINLVIIHSFSLSLLVLNFLVCHSFEYVFVWTNIFICY